MLKITFTSPQRIIQDGLPHDCMFVVCHEIRLINGSMYIDRNIVVDAGVVDKIEPYKL